MEKWILKVNDYGRCGIYFGNHEKDVIMKVWFESNRICINNQTECDDIEIPAEVIKYVMKLA